jgi:alkylation response protein AidB-like acyl-CoA dehydrogenase
VPGLSFWGVRCNHLGTLVVDAFVPRLASNCSRRCSASAISSRSPLSARAFRLAHRERITPHVLTIELDQVEGVEEHARLFRMLVPRSLGGEELSPVEYVQAIEEIAKADALVAAGDLRVN